MLSGCLEFLSYLGLWLLLVLNIYDIEKLYRRTDDLHRQIEDLKKRLK